MKKFFYFATALIALASCSSEEYIGDQNLKEANENAPITFNSGSQNLTRADKTGAAAATDLDNHFYVYGIKNEKNDGAGNVQSGNLVYKNYVVKYVASSANTSASNTENWEYAGYTLDANERTQVVVNSGDAAQTIKYWDWGAADYTFYAVSAAAADITAKNVTITKNQTLTSSVYDNGYTVAVNASANLDKLFFAERVNITSTNNTDRTKDNTYGGNVTFRFHNMSTKVRVAMYEDIPGYSVTIDAFLTQASATPTFAGMTSSVTDNFAANFVNSAKGTAGTLTVTYYADGTTKNYPKASFAQTGDAANVLNLGTVLKKDVTIGESATAATYDKAEKAYTSVFPKEDNAQNLKLKLNYTLTAPVTGEKITVEGATAEIPASYLKWKPGFAYTYIFKISDNSNGQTGTGETPAGLYPITFDAVEVVADDGQAEYITTVSEPSITTFGVTGTTYVYGGNEYAANSDIYATFMEGSAVKSPTVGGTGAQHVNIYKVTTADATNFPITEASVAEAIANPGSYSMSVDVYTYDGTSTYTKVTDAKTLVNGTTYYKADASSNAPGTTGYTQTPAVLGTDYIIPKVTPTNITSDGSTNFTATPAKVDKVPGEDGVEITIDALKLTGVKAGTYAIEYEASAAWTGSYKKVYKVIVVQ